MGTARRSPVDVIWFAPVVFALVMGSMMLGVTRVTAQDLEHQNLQVLPDDITRRALNQIMVQNLSGLGLPRRGGEGCLFCHEGDMDVPRGEWDYASDAKVQKRKAREMLAMTAEINERLSGLEGRVAPDLEVTCYTCHKGRTDPRSLTDRMVEGLRASGVDSAIVVYRDLREQYFGADAYDFRPGTLLGLAGGVAASGAFDAALALSELNEEYNPASPAVRRGTITLEVQKALSEDGVDAALERFDRALGEEPSGTVSFSILDNVGWPLFRNDEEPDAIRIFRRNLDAFPDRYVPNESLAEALYSVGERVEGVTILAAWTEAHPDDDQARRVLINMRARGG